MMSVLIKCECGKRFPINPLKHPRDDFVYCPFCHRAIENPYKQRILPSFNLKWLTERVNRWKYYREVDKLLKEYGFKKEIIDPNTGRRKVVATFSLSDWKKGKRPKITREDVINHLPKGASNMEIEREMQRINKMFQKRF